MHFTSATETIKLTYEPLVAVAPESLRPQGEMSPHSFDVTVDGDIVGNGVDQGGFATIEGLPKGLKVLEVWLPQASALTLLSLTIDEGTTAVIEPEPRPVWLTYGSSLTHCTRAHSPACTWPALVARQHGLHLVSLGFGGDCHMEAMLGFHIRTVAADYITLKLGINTLGTLGPRTCEPCTASTLLIPMHGCVRARACLPACLCTHVLRLPACLCPRALLYVWLRNQHTSLAQRP